MIFQVHSNRSIADIEQGLNESAARNKFGVLHVHDLQETMKKKGVDLALQCRIYEVCNPHQAKLVLEAEGSISTALPCRISVYGKEGDWTVATMLPTEMLKGFSRPDIEPAAKEVEDAVVRIVKDAAGVA
jgi:uncharacterized protein (DUF302 family)